MKRFAIPVAMMVFLFVGCKKPVTVTVAPPAPPSPGKANLIVHVVAEPKAGLDQKVIKDAYGNEHLSSGGSGRGPFEEVDYASLDHIVVWAESDGGGATQTSIAPVSVDVDAAVGAGELTLPVCVGQQVTFHNAGAKGATVYSVSDGNEFDCGTLKPGESGNYAVKSAGLIEIYTDAQPAAIARLYAAPTPIFAMTHAGQDVVFRDLPPGKYTVRSWHPRVPGHEADVTLGADQSGEATVHITVNGLPAVTP